MPPKLVDLCGSGPWAPPSLLSIYKLGDGSHQHWYICMVRGHGGHQTRLVYRVWGRGVLWLLAGPSERTQNSRTKPGPKGPQIYFSERSDLAVSFGSGPLRRACKGPGPKGSNKYLSDLSDMACCKPHGRAHNPRTKPGPKGPTNNLSDLSDLAPCRPREEAQGLRTRLGPKGLENYCFGHFGPGLVLGLCIGLARGQFRKVRQVNFSDLSDLACCRPREEAHDLRTRPCPNGPTG